MLWDGRRAPFTLLGGYLGAGKTTIVNHVIGAAVGRRIVVLVNDVGAVNVDAALIGARDGSTLTLTNGCVCCAIADDLAVTLELVRAMPEPPDHVLMELSGVAEPARVAPWASTTGFRLDGIVVAADADQIVELAARDYIADTIVEQLRAADLILLTKTDLVADAGAVAAAFVSEHTAAPILPVVDGAADVEVVLGIGGSGPTEGAACPAPGVAHQVGHLDPGRATWAELDAMVRSLPDDVVRAKGIVRCVDESDPVEVQVVGIRRTVRRRPDLAGAEPTGIVTITVPVR